MQREDARRQSERAARTFLLHPKQYDFVMSDTRFAFYVGGVGAGKTVAGALRAILRAKEQPGSLGLIGAPTYPMLRDATQRTFFELLPRALVKDFSRTEQHLTLHNEAEILFRSMDQPDRTRGSNLAWFWLDEAPLCGHYAWTILKARLRQQGFAPGAWATGTPHGRDGYAKEFELERKPDDTTHALYRASTRDNLDNLPPGYIEDLGYTGQFAAQEIDGLFVAFDGLVYALDASEGGNVRAPAEGQQFATVIGGLDWGYTNPTAAVVFGLDGDRRAWQLDEWYQRRASRDEVTLPALVELTRKHNVARWYADPEDPGAIDAFNAALAKAGLTCRAQPAKKGPGSVRAGIQTVTTLLALRGDGTRGLYVAPSCVNTLAEYGTYCYASATARRDAGEEPVKQNDHAMDGSRYALHGELAGAAATEAYLAALVEHGRVRQPAPIDPADDWF